MSTKIRVGVVGTSWWSDMMHFPALESHSQAELAAICGRNQNRANEIASKYGASDTFSDYREMIKDTSLDAIIIASPQDLHYEMTMVALDAGLHVLCEKPLAMDAQQAWEMFQKAEAVGIKHMTYFTFRWNPIYQFVRDLLSQGAIGRFYHCEFQFLGGNGRSHEYQWQFDRKRSSGVLGNLGTHMIDMARWFVGDITSISAQLGVSVERSGADGGAIDPVNDSALILVRFRDGAQGTIQTSQVAHTADRGSYQQIKLYGEAGTLEVDLIFWGSEARMVIRAAGNHDKQFQILEVPDYYWGAADPSDIFSIVSKNSVGTRAFIDAILEDRPIEPNFYDGFKAQQVIDAALASHERGCAVSIDNTV